MCAAGVCELPFPLVAVRVQLHLYFVYRRCNVGQSRLREIFLKTDNVISGSYLAEITKEVALLL
jgi:hypothetical protein